MLTHEQRGVADTSDGGMNATGALLFVSQTEALALPRDAAELAGPFPLRDGATLHQRAIRVDDAPRLQRFHRRLSDRSVFFRFAGIIPELNRELAERLCRVDYAERMAIVVTAGRGVDEPIIAVARYERNGHDTAEFAIAVDDAWQARGIGPRLVRTLARYALNWGFTSFLANVLYDNDRMLALLRHSGMLTTLRIRDGYAEAWLDITGARSANDAR